MTVDDLAGSLQPPAVPPRSFVQPRVLTVLGTYRCTAMCDHCCVDSNPWIKQRLSLDRILSFIDEADRFPSVQLVAFSGGECFLLGDDLAAAVAHARQKGLRTRCVTNGYWAKSLDRGRMRLQQLTEAGLNELNVSTGDYHQKWVAESTVINAVCLADELGLDTSSSPWRRKSTATCGPPRCFEDPRLAALAQRLPRDRFQVIESPWMPMDARKTIAQDVQNVLTRRNVQSRRGCDSIFSTVVLTPSDKIGICCGLSRELIPELNLESNRPLEQLLESAGTDFMKIWLFVDGPERILHWAAQRDPKIEWEGRYAHHCQACLALFDDARVRNAIKSGYRERVTDVLMRYSIILRRRELQDGAVYA